MEDRKIIGDKLYSLIKNKTKVNEYILQIICINANINLTKNEINYGIEYLLEIGKLVDIGYGQYSVKDV